ncbi:hypothetical protein BJX76DRAFT_362147 [Aspergillus varians]
MCYNAAGRRQDAIQIFRKVLHGYEKSLGPDNSHGLETKKWLASNYVRLGRQDARSLLEQVVEDYKRVLGPEIPETLDALLQVGYHLAELRCFPEAESSIRAAYTGHAKVSGWDHVSTLESAVALADVCRAGGQASEAVRILQEMLDNQSVAPLSSLTPNPHTMFLTARLLETLEKQEEAIVAYLRFQATSRHSPQLVGFFQELTAPSLKYLSSQPRQVECDRAGDIVN